MYFSFSFKRNIQKLCKKIHQNVEMKSIAPFLLWRSKVSVIFASFCHERGKWPHCEKAVQGVYGLLPALLLCSLDSKLRKWKCTTYLSYLSLAPVLLAQLVKLFKTELFFCLNLEP